MGGGHEGGVSGYKLKQVMLERERRKPLEGSAGMDDAYLGGARNGVGFKGRVAISLGESEQRHITLANAVRRGRIT
jgi:hypothetical protein